MNTPAHLLIGAAAFGRGRGRRVMLAAVFGALLPDVALYIMAGTALFIRQIPQHVVFGELYYSRPWQAVFAIDNSLFVWAAVLALAIWRKSDVGIAFAGAGILHLVADFWLHSGDGHPHFWPLTSWVYDSPVSYWDSHHHAHWVAPVAVLACFAAYAVLWNSGMGRWAKIGFAGLLGAELWVGVQWLQFF